MSVELIKKWGNSPAIRIPQAVLEAAHLNLNQPVEVSVQGGRIIIAPAAPDYDLDRLVEAITPENRHLEMDFGRSEGQEMI